MRLLLAEANNHDATRRLLQNYLETRREVEQHHAVEQLATGDEQIGAYRRVQPAVHREQVARAKEALAQKPQPPKDDITMAEMFRLAAVPPPPGEDVALAAVVRKVEATRTVVTLPSARTIRTRLENSSGSAGPGPSGQRLKYIQQMAKTKMGMRAIQGFAAIELRNRWLEDDGQLWH